MQVEDTTTGRQEIGTSQANSFLYVTSLVIADMVGNPVVPISPSRALQMGPVLEAFALDMNAGELALTFSEDVVGNRSVSTTALTRQSFGGNYTDAKIDARRAHGAAYVPGECREELRLSATSASRSPPTARRTRSCSRRTTSRRSSAGAASP